MSTLLPLALALEIDAANACITRIISCNVQVLRSHQPYSCQFIGAIALHYTNKSIF
ncbi:MAG: hypothetical protein RM338_32760 [Nostoc sp. DedQUE12a]|nr:hypothetical protein [Nostoc sp. DedQUE12a]